MSLEFSEILQGLMHNRRLSARAVSRASGRAEATVNQLLIGRIAPRDDILHDIAPVLQIPVADLFAIAGIATDVAQGRPTPYRATAEIGQLVAAASFLTPEQVKQLVDQARDLMAQNLNEQP